MVTIRNLTIKYCLGKSTKNSTKNSANESTQIEMQVRRHNNDAIEKIDDLSKYDKICLILLICCTNYDIDHDINNAIAKSVTVGDVFDMIIMYTPGFVIPREVVHFCCVNNIDIDLLTDRFRSWLFTWTAITKHKTWLRNEDTPVNIVCFMLGGILGSYTPFHKYITHRHLDMLPMFMVARYVEDMNVHHAKVAKRFKEIENNIRHMAQYDTTDMVVQSQILLTAQEDCIRAHEKREDADTYMIERSNSIHIL